MDASPLEDWQSPFCVFDEADFEDIRFFKKKTERGPIESLMSYGPDALRLPHAFARYEIFGQVQSGITNDLQVGRGKESVLLRISCEEVPSYRDRVEECETIRDHVKNLQGASLHVLTHKDEGDANVVAFPDAQKSFSKLNRKGFDGDAFERKAAFEKAAHALVALERQLIAYTDALKARSLDPLFDQDREIFKQHLATFMRRPLNE